MKFKRQQSEFSRMVTETLKERAKELGYTKMVNGSDYPYDDYCSLGDRGFHQSMFENRKNCYTCKFMEWGEGDVGDPQGWICTRKDFSIGREESDMIEKMNNSKYRFKSKVCHGRRK